MPCLSSTFFLSFTLAMPRRPGLFASGHCQTSIPAAQREFAYVDAEIDAFTGTG